MNPDVRESDLGRIADDDLRKLWGASAREVIHADAAAETPVLVDGDFRGEPKKMLMQTSRNGYFVVLDRTNGKFPR